MRLRANTGRAAFDQSLKEVPHISSGLFFRIAIGALLTIAALTFLSSPAAAEHCEDGGDTAFASGRAQVRGIDCDHLGGSDGVELTAAQRWEIYCNTVGVYTVGDTVQVDRLDEVTSGTAFTFYSLSYDGRVGVPEDFQQITVDSRNRYFNYAISCVTPSGVTVRNLVLPAGDPTVSPIALRNEVKASITITDPNIASNPPLDDPDRYSFVRIPTWLWIEDPWDPITKSDSRGGISVSVTATPERVVWETGDGEPPTVCKGPGTRWRKGLKESHSKCKHEYTRSSAGAASDDAFELSATVHWTFTWELNNSPQGQFATYEPTTAVRHQVGEIQIVSS